VKLELGLSAADFRELAQLAGTVYYGAPPRDGETACLAGLVDLGRCMVIRDGDEMVGGAATCHLELTVPGGHQVPAAGLTEVVAVLPTHRRRGLLRQMIAAHAEDARAHGELVSLLMATEGGIYHRFGYGPGTMRADWQLARAGATLRGEPNARGRARLVAAHEAETLLPAIFEKHRRRQAGELARPLVWWTAYANDPTVVHRGPRPLQHVVYETDAGPQGYAAWHFQPVWNGSMPDHVVTVVELVAHSAPGTDGLLRFLTQIDVSTRLVLLNRPVSDPVRWCLTDPRQLRPRDVRDFLWVRMLDTERALASRWYPITDTLVVEIADPTGVATGRFRLEASPDGASCRRTTASADLTVAASDLATCFLGGVGFVNLAQAGQLDEHSDGAIERAERLFRTPTDPCCSTQF
jgi:predicted acetyltransferase